MHQNRSAGLIRGIGISAVALFLVVGTVLGADAIFNQSPASSDPTNAVSSSAPIETAEPTGSPEVGDDDASPEPIETAEPTGSPEVGDDEASPEPIETAEPTGSPEVGDDDASPEPIETAEPTGSPDDHGGSINTPEPGDDSGGGSSGSGGSSDDGANHG